MSEALQAIRGMDDLLPGESDLWLYVEDTIRSVIEQHGYDHIRMPIVEQTELFARGVGETTDVVEKEMYTFNDRNELSLSLRPEGTAGCVRACQQHGLLYNQIQRLWYQGPMFRYEKPQKGRNRQFHQVGLEVFGIGSAEIDAEVIAMNHRMWRRLGIEQAVTLQINTIGSAQARMAHRKALVAFLEQYRSELDEDSQRRLDKNPLRILDSKVASTQALLKDAPALSNYIDDESAEHFEAVKASLTRLGIEFEVNETLVRGLDYYNGTVYEWVTDALGAQGTICGGGRYDGLVEQLGGRPTPAFGCGIGMERVTLLLKAVAEAKQSSRRGLDAYGIALGDAANKQLHAILDRIRDQALSLRIRMHCGTGKANKLLKKAADSGAEYALIVGESELAEGTVTLKPLRGQGDAKTIAVDDAGSVLLMDKQ